MNFGAEHDYLPPADSSHEDDDDFLPTINDDGLGVGDWQF